MKITRWGISRANLDPVIGSEQGKTRPVLVISDDDVNTLLHLCKCNSDYQPKAGPNGIPQRSITINGNTQSTSRINRALPSNPNFGQAKVITKV